MVRQRRAKLTVLFSATLATLAACAPVRTPIAKSGPSPSLIVATSALYQRYGDALAAGRRDAIASVYHYEGALIVFNGVARRQTREDLRQRYLTSWNPPDFFEWQNLAFDAISTSQVLVTGGFRWKSAGQADTSRYIYAALVVASDSGMAIVFEHETLRPPR